MESNPVSPFPPMSFSPQLPLSLHPPLTSNFRLTRFQQSKCGTLMLRGIRHVKDENKRRPAFSLDSRLIKLSLAHLLLSYMQEMTNKTREKPLWGSPPVIRSFPFGEDTFPFICGSFHHISALVSLQSVSHQQSCLISYTSCSLKLS